LLNQRGTSEPRQAIAIDLKKMFDATMFDRLGAYEVLRDRRSFERSDKDESAIGIFGTLPTTVDAIPSSLINTAEEHRSFIKEQLKIIP
jgi:hypothetical protein